MKTYLLSLIAIFKAKAAILFSVLMAFFLPVKPLFLVVGAFICADTLIGLYKARKIKETITSRKLSNVISKMVLYQSAVLLFFILEKFIVGEFVTYFVTIPFFLTKVVAATLCLIEAKSIDESYTLIKGYSLWDRFKTILKRVKETKDELGDINPN